MCYCLLYWYLWNTRRVKLIDKTFHDFNCEYIYILEKVNHVMVISLCHQFVYLNV